jgi:uncharacterized membrane protein YraQ (UPF0718 family)
LLFVDEQKLLAFMPRNVVLAALAGSLIGFMFPVCECGNIPVARRLLMKGAPTAVAIGYLLAAPTVNPIVFWATWVAFRDQPEIVFLRVIFTLVVAVTIAVIFSTQKDMRPFVQDNLARLMGEPEKSPIPGRNGHDAGGATATEPSPLLQSGSFLIQSSGQVLQLSAPPAQTLAMVAEAPNPWLQGYG